jgi:hypothetical protein
MKIKGSEYVRLHKILTNISNRHIWECLKDKKPLDEIIEKVPDEFYNWVKETKENFEKMDKEGATKANIPYSQYKNLPNQVNHCV